MCVSLRLSIETSVPRHPHEAEEAVTRERRRRRAVSWRRLGVGGLEVGRGPRRGSWRKKGNVGGKERGKRGGEEEREEEECVVSIGLGRRSCVTHFDGPHKECCGHSCFRWMNSNYDENDECNWLYILIQFKSKLRPDLKLSLLTKYSFPLFWMADIHWHIYFESSELQFWELISKVHKKRYIDSIYWLNQDTKYIEKENS